MALLYFTTANCTIFRGTVYGGWYNRSFANVHSGFWFTATTHISNNQRMYELGEDPGATAWFNVRDSYDRNTGRSIRCLVGVVYIAIGGWHYYNFLKY